MSNEELVVVGPHFDMVLTQDKDELKKKVLNIIKVKKTVRSGEIWKEVNCHLWELYLVLKELKEENKINEV
ncbi:MAG: hypothetical protein QXS21_01675 [Thermoproteota archaeon]|nr:hypothetical protein [Candidatus Brockarchaeota archaeon]MBO3768580.1 hypothetical protein [Candidatus Brockarchaeota archaeon]MBO3800753.1 hypothetical protein [Candidatus Brockarchaeota archaeon]